MIYINIKRLIVLLKNIGFLNLKFYILMKEMNLYNYIKIYKWIIYNNAYLYSIKLKYIKIKLKNVILLKIKSK